MRDELVLVRGGGDLATGCIWRLWRAGFPVVVCELARPLTVRRTVAVSRAVTEGRCSVEGMPAELAASADVAAAVARRGEVAVLVAPELPTIERSVVGMACAKVTPSASSRARTPSRTGPSCSVSVPPSRGTLPACAASKGTPVGPAQPLP